MNMIDLHIHTNASDGSDSVPELLAHLQDAGIDTFAVTDHDTIDAAVTMEELLPSGMRYVKGVEFSCITPLRKCHLLGYCYDEADPQLNAALQEGAALRRKKLEGRLAYLRETYQIEFTEEELTWLHSQKSPGKPHIADLLLKRGVGTDRNDLIQNFIRGTSSGSDRITAQMAVSGILHAGGIPVWAHPLGGEGEKLLSGEAFEEQLHYLIQCGIRGLECYYSRYTEEQVSFLCAAAEKHSLLISGGSDYHGSRKNIALGTLNAYHAPVNEAQLTILREL
ncbi:MAG: PHP domain-containing protein [Lachnospiraceae bacterium]|nr:PHP domain-containing protein [Lachnospiraceae bacterium]